MEDRAQSIQGQFFNVPNQLTTLRLVLSIVVFILIPLKMYVSAIIIFLIAASTDWVDGYWARRYAQVTKLGRVFDPFVDKIIICGAFILLAAEPESGIQAWMAVVVVGREMLVTTLRSFIEQSGGDFSAKMAGKVKMVLQCVAVVVSLLALMHTTREPATWLAWTRPIVFWALPIAVWVSVISTIYSGVGYAFVAAKYLR
ncbi:MAG: CDP-diacylglycerol--glycerol-3-phosphate 3-phosphatidyltransferase [Pirellulaceae bacterium]